VIVAARGAAETASHVPVVDPESFLLTRAPMQDLARGSMKPTGQDGNPHRAVVQRPDAAGSGVLLASADAEASSTRARELGERGVRVHVARTGFEAIVKATCHLPRVVLLDDSLGAEAVAETTRLLAGCPMTAHIPVMRVTPRRGVPARLLQTLAAAAAL
jgi:CheY-like chemotaxis protein